MLRKHVGEINDQEVEIRILAETDYGKIFKLMQDEGEEWSEYYQDQEKYSKALTNSFVYGVFVKHRLCGYVRCKDDDGFGIYIYDLLVDAGFRGRDFGKLLMERVYLEKPNNPIYVMSDVDLYYQKLGYEKEGSIFIVSTKKELN